uniref:Uncharacterized protein n=1 Tax=viral metagenome TaxID=1070528 RepID=A0A6M3LGG0_9ZZZZ
MPEEKVWYEVRLSNGYTFFTPKHRIETLVNNTRQPGFLPINPMHDAYEVVARGETIKIRLKDDFGLVASHIVMWDKATKPVEVI